MGFPAGAIINVIGDKSAGKSFLKNEMLACNYHKFKKRFKWFSDDTESGDTFDTKGLYGVSLMPEDRKIGKVPMKHSETVEEMDVQVGLFAEDLKANEVGIYAIDSLDGLCDNSKLDRSDDRKKQFAAGKEVQDSGTFGTNQAKFLSQEFFKTKHAVLKKKNALLFIVSQVRDKLDAMSFGKKYTVSSGKALEFYAHTRLELRTVKKLKRKDTVIGVLVQAETVKSKTNRPFRKCRFPIYFDYGIDDIGASLDYLYDLRGKEGDLLSAAKTVPWSAKEPKNLKNILAWLKGLEGDLYDKAKADKKAGGGTGNMSLDYLQEWLPQQEDIYPKFMEHFGEPVSREILIAQIENDPKMKKELDRRVIKKWNDFEDSIQSIRKSKY